MTEKSESFFGGTEENLYKMLSFMGLYNIHNLKTRNPKLYAKIMGESSKVVE